MDYLEKAADQIQQAITGIERTLSPGGDTITDRRMQAARAYALLAAIDRGLLPRELAADIYRSYNGKD